MAGRKPRKPWPEAHLLKAAEQFFIHGTQQQDIAKDLGYSRQDISRMLQAAREQGIVEIRIKAPVIHTDLRELATKINRKFPILREVVLVPGHPELLSPSVSDAIRSGVAATIAQAAADFLARTLSARDVVVVGRGHMVKNIVEVTHLPEPLPGLRIVPMQGFLGDQYDYLAANVIAEDLQKVTRGTYHWLPAPAIVSKDDIPIVEKLPIVSQTLELMNSATVLLTCLGAINRDKINVLKRMGFPSDEIEGLYKRARSEGNSPLAGEIGGWLYRADGTRLKDVSWRPLGYEIHRMQELAKGDGLAICAVGADRSRLKALLGALKGGFFNVLITDHSTAEAIYNMVRKEAPSEDSGVQASES